MAQIYVIGRVGEDLLVHKTRKDSPYVCFSLWEQACKYRTPPYQVWAWNENAARLVELGVKKGSLIWLAGTMRLADTTRNGGREKTRLVRISLSDWGYLSGRHPAPSGAEEAKETGHLQKSRPSPSEVMDGDRTALPE